MSLLPQPPPDEPAPPPCEAALDSRRKMNWIWWLGGLLIGVPLLLFLSAPVILRAHKAAERAEALNNMKQIGMMLFEFDAEYGQFPDAATIPAVKAATSTPLTLDDKSSNQLFRQLLTDRRGVSEKPFYAQIPGSRRPDDVFNTDATALQKGECAFAYVAGLSTSSEPSTPIVMTAMIPGQPLFDTTTKWGKKGLVLRLDLSTTPMQIDHGGRVLNGGPTRDLLDPAQPYWKGKAPDLKWQE